jgi:hypothetical protein
MIVDLKRGRYLRVGARMGLNIFSKPEPDFRQLSPSIRVDYRSRTITTSSPIPVTSLQTVKQQTPSRPLMRVHSPMCSTIRGVDGAVTGVELAPARLTSTHRYEALRVLRFACSLFCRRRGKVFAICTARLRRAVHDKLFARRRVSEGASPNRLR